MGKQNMKMQKQNSAILQILLTDSKGRKEVELNCNTRIGVLH